MSREQKLIEKVKRKERLVKESAPGFVKMKKPQEVLAASPKALELMRGMQRRFDGSFGLQTTGAEPALEVKLVAASLERFDFGVSDFGLLLTLAAGFIADVGFVVGDYVQVREEGSAAEGRILQVVSLESATELRLDDVSTFGLSTETDVAIRAILSGTKKSFT